MPPIHRKNKPCVKLRILLFEFSHRREQNVDVLRRGEKGRRTRRGAQFEIDKAVLEEGLEDGGGGVADGGLVGEEGVDVFAEEGEEAFFFFMYMRRCFIYECLYVRFALHT